MIYRSTNPVSPKTIVQIGDMSVDYSSVSGFEIELTENEHDFATIILNGAPPESITDFFNRPVYLKIDSGVGRVQEFKGYVVAVEPVNVSKMGWVNGSVIQFLKLRCLSASYLMKAVSSRVWEYPTLHNILSDLAFKYRFSAEYPQDTFKPTRMTQANESDWSFLRRVVQTYGYSMSAHGTHIYVWDVSKARNKLPSYTILSTSNNMSSDRPGLVLNFEADMGHVSLSGDNSGAVLNNLDSYGNVVTVSARNSTLRDTRTVRTSLFERPIKGTYQTLGEAEKAIEAEQRNRNLFTARAEVVAGAGIVPGGIVALGGYGGEFDGTWYVSNVLHKMYNNMYTTELKLFKNDFTSEESIPGAFTTADPAPESTLINKQWVSASGKVTQYV